MPKLDYVYIDPTTIGVNRATAQHLGLGGYYVITTVDSQLSRDGYETRLKCTFNHSPYMKKKKSDTTSLPNDLNHDQRAEALADIEKENANVILENSGKMMNRDQLGVATPEPKSVRENLQGVRN